MPAPAHSKLLPYIELYRLDIDGVAFWTPYWRDVLPSLDNPKPASGPYKGKGTPDQIKDLLLEKLGEQRLSDGEAYRKLMFTELHLGVECSGFIYNVLEPYLADHYKVVLKEQLFKPRAALLEDFANPVYTHPEHITQELLEAQPEQVPLSTIQEFWGNQPVRLAGVKILTSPAANRRFSQVDQLREADVITMMGHDKIAHAVIVTAVEADTIHYAHSGGAHDRADVYGGIELGSIKITDASAPIQDQDWVNEAGRFIVEHHDFDAHPLCRLNILDRD